MPFLMRMYMYGGSVVSFWILLLYEQFTGPSQEFLPPHKGHPMHVLLSTSAFLSTGECDKDCTTPPRAPTPKAWRLTAVGRLYFWNRSLNRQPKSNDQNRICSSVMSTLVWNKGDSVLSSLSRNMVTLYLDCSHIALSSLASNKTRSLSLKAPFLHLQGPLDSVTTCSFRILSGGISLEDICDSVKIPWWSR